MMFPKSNNEKMPVGTFWTATFLSSIAQNMDLPVSYSWLRSANFKSRFRWRRPAIENFAHSPTFADRERRSTPSRQRHDWLLQSYRWFWLRVLVHPPASDVAVMYFWNTLTIR